MRKFLSFTLILAIIANFAFGQETKEVRLTHHMSEDEKSKTHLIGKNFQATDPPAGEVRNIAEWESMEGVIVTYLGTWDEFGVPYELIAEMSENVTVTTIVENSSEETTVRGYYENNGVNLDNCNFLIAPVDSYWTRDYTAWYVAVDNSDVSVVDFIYNRPRPNDDAMPSKMADFLGVDYYGMSVVHTGGNYMTDGMGISASTPIVYTESWSEEGITETEVDERMLAYLGIHTYHVVDDPMDDYIDHVDCWAKFLDVDKILITQVPETDYRYDDFEAAAAYFAEQNCSYGYPYQVYRVQAADYYDYDTNPYTNSLILNDKVFVPQTGSTLDDDAIAVYEEAMPGYKIIGMYAGENAWQNTDALHCRTHGIADREMLYIKHIPLFGTVNSNNGYLVETEIYSYAGNDLQTGFPKLFYKVDDGNFTEIEMTESKSNTFQATIPEQAEGSIISYYIEAEDVSSKNEMHPQQGEYDPHIFTAGTESNVFVAENTISEDFNIYPNPNNGNFFVWLDMENGTEIEISINSITGKNILNEKKSVTQNLQKIEIDIPAGIYNLSITTSENKISKKLIITK